MKEVRMMDILNAKTAVGKSTKTALWVLVSTTVMAILSTVLNKPELFSPQVVAVANVVLVLLKNVLDPSVKNY